MRLVTRCPSCATMFLVVPDQLRVSEGWVRCGRCANVFNAAEDLLDVETGAPVQLDLSPPQAAVVAQATPNIAATRAPTPAPHWAADTPSPTNADAPAPARTTRPTPETAVRHYDDPLDAPLAQDWSQAPDPLEADTPPQRRPEAARTRPSALDDGLPEHLLRAPSATEAPSKPLPAAAAGLGWAASTAAPRGPGTLQPPAAGWFDPAPTTARAPAGPAPVPPEHSAAGFWAPAPPPDLAAPQERARSAEPGSASIGASTGTSISGSASAPPNASPNAEPYASPSTAAGQAPGEAPDGLADRDSSAAPASGWADKPPPGLDEAAPRPTSGPAPAAGTALLEADLEADVDSPAQARPEFSPSLAGAPSFLRQAERAQRWQNSPWRAWFHGLASLLVLLLLAQLAVVWRDALAARVPALAPVLQAACQPLGCSLQPLRRIELLAVDSSGLKRVDEQPGPEGFRYRFSVLLHNRADTALMAPAMELTLSDSRGDVVIRRVLQMADFGVAPEALAAGQELPLRLLLATGDRRIEGYTVELFYP